MTVSRAFLYFKLDLVSMKSEQRAESPPLLFIFHPLELRLREVAVLLDVADNVLKQLEIKVDHIPTSDGNSKYAIENASINPHRFDIDVRLCRRLHELDVRPHLVGDGPAGVRGHHALVVEVALVAHEGHGRAGGRVNALIGIEVRL